MAQSNVVEQVPTEGDFPFEWAFDGLLMNGASVRVRPIRSSDAVLIVKFGDVLAPHFVLGFDTVEEAAEKISSANYSSTMAFVVIASDEIIGIATYGRAGAKDPWPKSASMWPTSTATKEWQHSCLRVWPRTRAHKGWNAFTPR